MTRHNFTDALVHDGQIRTTDDGAVVQARVARAGNVQAYLGSELGLFDRAVVRVYRPADAVFNNDAITTYARKPITLGHPSGGVTADNWKDLAVGEIDRDVMRDGDFVSVPLLFRDANAIAALRAPGADRELSMGYDAQVKLEDGVSPTGDPYDAIMTDFNMNHVAVVKTARGGDELRIGDNAVNWGASPIHTLADTKGCPMADNMLTVVIGDQAAQIAVADAPKLEAFKAAQVKRISDMEASHAAIIAAKDAEIAKADAAKDAAESKVLSDAAIDARVAARGDLLDAVKIVAPDVKTAGLSDAAIRKSVVVAKLGDTMVDKPDAYIDARFDTLVEAVQVDPVVVALDGTSTPAKIVDLNTVYADRDKDLSNAWKTPANKGA